MTVQTHHLDAYVYMQPHMYLCTFRASLPVTHTHTHTHTADLFAVTVVMKVLAVEADEGPIYCVFFHGRVPQEGKNKLNARFVPLAQRADLKFNSSRERKRQKISVCDFL